MQQPKSTHQYATRIRHAPESKPAHRRTQSPDPLLVDTNASATPATEQPPTISPPFVVLHPDDANSKVFLAIERSFRSVDNRAMTIKDLAEMTVKFGLVCQNVSAASQAITTYIRSHMQRCEAQQDTPLLLKHSLSGTSLDDHLLPALYSRSGGAHSPNTENRATNFRRGTMVWYLSRATGASCPFSRAGIRLCDYSESSKPEQKKGSRKVGEEQSCGQKRKRLRTRHNQSGDESEASSDETKRPPKVMLTLRLKPSKPASVPPAVNSLNTHLSTPSDDSMSSDSSSDEEEENRAQEEQTWPLPPYPRRSISIPSYTPCLSSFSSYPFYPESPSTSTAHYRRSPSVSYSVGSPPPDSEDEDDFSRAMTVAKPFPMDDLAHPDWDSDVDGETMWESPGPRSPSAPAPLTPQYDDDSTVTIKQEPHDVQSMLDAWDGHDAVFASVDKPLPITTPVKVEASTPSLWGWDDTELGWSSPLLDDLFVSEPVPSIKQEDLDYGSLLGAEPVSPLASYGQPQYASPDKHSRRHVKWEDEFDPVADAAVASPSHSLLPPLRLEMPNSTSFPDHAQSPTLATLASLIQSMSMSSPTAVSPAALRMTSGNPPPALLSGLPSTDSVVVYTCSPCTPTVSATQVEGISVYQMTLGSSRLLRRIDTDFVNLSPIIACAEVPVPTIPTAVVVNKGSLPVVGTWVPLQAAQTYVKSCLSSTSSPHKLSPSQRDALACLLDVFLSDVLFERFPSALQDFHRSSTSRRLLNQFGPHFHSTLTPFVTETQPTSVDLVPSLSWVPRSPSYPDFPQDDVPLSQPEQEMFRALCTDPEWEETSPSDEVTSPAPSPSDCADLTEPSIDIPSPEESLPSPIPAVQREQLSPLPPPEDVISKPLSPSLDAPLRRSKRVADALATKAKTRSTRRRGSTKALS